MSNLDSPLVAKARQFFELLTLRDFDTWGGLLAAKAVVSYPFAPKGFPTRVEGRESIVDRYRTGMSSRKRIEFLDLSFTPLSEGAVLVEGRGESELADGRVYRNRYAMLFRFEDELLVALDEYFNPIALLETYGDAATAAAMYRNKRV
jgi:hypothetical protein